MFDLAIVIPAYKANFLRETLKSIEAQTDKRFHLYIGDDCSPENISEIVDEFRFRIPLTYKRFNSNLGAYDLVTQWERCIAMTNGEPWIWLFSDDDTMDSKCVEEFYRSVEKYPTQELFHFNINMIDELDGGELKPLPEFPAMLSAGAFLESKLRGKIVSYVVEFIFSRRLYEAVNGFENFDLAWGSDFMTWLKMAAVSKSGIFTIQGNNCYVNWRRSAENISPNKSHPIIIRKIKALIKNAAFINREMTQNPECYLPLRKSFRWVRFPLGEILRSRNGLLRNEISKLCFRYYKEVGYPIQTLISYFKIKFF